VRTETAIFAKDIATPSLSRGDPASNSRSETAKSLPECKVVSSLSFTEKIVSLLCLNIFRETGAGSAA